MPLREALYGELRLPVLVGLGAVGVLLAIACINASTLLLVHTTARRTEFALRAAIGAGARRVALQVLAESMLLAVIGGALGAALAAAGTKLLTSALPRTR